MKDLIKYENEELLWKRDVKERIALEKKELLWKRNVGESLIKKGRNIAGK